MLWQLKRYKEGLKIIGFTLILCGLIGLYFKKDYFIGATAIGILILWLGYKKK